MNNLQLTNSLTRKKETFKPIDPKKISLYACGPTVYDNPHVGNGRSLVIFDVLFRLLKKIYGPSVNYVRNITDVDDKIIEASKKNKKRINEITQEVTKIFHASLMAPRLITFLNYRYSSIENTERGGLHFLRSDL